MSKAKSLPITKVVRNALTDAGWEPWSYYCDKIKAGKKRKWYRNGYGWSFDELKPIGIAVADAMNEAGIEYIEAGWKQCESWRGPYWAFIVRSEK